MNLYHYDRETGHWQGVTQAREDPMQPGRYLVPAHATTTAPPMVPVGKVAKFAAGDWSLVDAPPPPDITQPSTTDGPLDPIIADLIAAVTAPAGPESDAAKQRLSDKLATRDKAQ